MFANPFAGSFRATHSGIAYGKRQALIMYRIALIIAACLGITSCMSIADYAPPTKANLLDPLPGKALVYLLRSPDDPLFVTISVDGVKSAELPPEKYTAISLVPGSHLITTLSKSTKPQDQLPSLTLTTIAGKRYFLALPAPEIKTESGIVGFIPAGKFPIPLMGTRISETGAPRAWIEVQEDESHWLFSTRNPSSRKSVRFNDFQIKIITSSFRAPTANSHNQKQSPPL